MKIPWQPLLCNTFILGTFLLFRGLAVAQSTGKQEIVLEGGQEERWDLWAAYPPGYEKWSREYLAAYRAGDYRKAVELSDRMIASTPHHTGGVFLWRSYARQRLGQIDAARSDVKTALAKASAGGVYSLSFFATCHRQLALLALAQHREDEALGYFRRALREDPADPKSYNSVAWILATSPSPNLRNGTEAVKLATTACQLTQWKRAWYVDTLAAACAESGDFPSAVKWQKRAIELDHSSKVKLSQPAARLALYEKKQAYHIPPK